MLFFTIAMVSVINKKTRAFALALFFSIFRTTIFNHL